LAGKEIALFTLTFPLAVSGHTKIGALIFYLRNCREISF